jgi:hypothetical protein
VKRIIWQYWETRGTKPAFIDGLYDLAKKNAGVPVIQVTPDTLGSYVANLPTHIHDIRELAHKADMIRTILVRDHGGMWLDSDAIVLQDLNWLFDLLADYEFVGFDDCAASMTGGLGKVRVNCFLSRPGGRILSEWVRLQHAKFPITTYSWEEIGSDLLTPLCASSLGAVKILPLETICPIPWYDVQEFSSRWHSPRQITELLERCIMIMMSNKALGKQSPETQDQTVAALALSDTLISHFIRRAVDVRYVPARDFRYLRHRLSRAGLARGVELMKRRIRHKP